MYQNITQDEEGKTCPKISWMFHLLPFKVQTLEKHVHIKSCHDATC